MTLFDVAYGIAAPGILPWLAWRAAFKSRGRHGWRDKFGGVAVRDPEKPRVWLHAVSVGEAEAARPLVAALDEWMKSVRGETVVSALTDTGFSAVTRLYGKDRAFFLPLDLTCCVNKSLRRVAPRALILMEQELWPNLTLACARLGIPVLIVNGRITERAARRYRKVLFMFRSVFRAVSAFAVQNEEYADRFVSLGADRAHIHVTGSIKYDAAPKNAEPAARGEMRKRLGIVGDALVVLGGSTHPTEETALLATWRELRSRYPGLRLVVAPRHPERFDAVEREIRSTGAACQRLTRLDACKTPDPDSVILVDAMGVLGRLYATADVAFVGGSLIPHGGQNVMEASAVAVPAVMGPHVFNFRDVCRDLEAVGGLQKVENAGGLANALNAWLADPSARAAAGTSAKKVIEKGRGATARTMEIIRSSVPFDHAHNP